MPHNPWLTVWISGSEPVPYSFDASQIRRFSLVMRELGKNKEENFSVAGTVTAKDKKKTKFDEKNLAALYLIDTSHRMSENTRLQLVKRLGDALEELKKPPSAQKLTEMIEEVERKPTKRGEIVPPQRH